MGTGPLWLEEDYSRLLCSRQMIMNVTYRDNVQWFCHAEYFLKQGRCVQHALNLTGLREETFVDRTN